MSGFRREVNERFDEVDRRFDTVDEYLEYLGRKWTEHDKEIYRLKRRKDA